jgi:hypothetical protein
MKWMFYSKPILTLNFVVINKDITIAIPQQEAGEIIEPEESIFDDGTATAGDSSRDEESMSDSSAGPTPVTSTSSGRMINKPTRLIEEAGAVMLDLKNLEEYEIKLTCAEEHYYEAMKVLQEEEFIPNKVNCVRAGIGSGFDNTKELHVMKYQQVMESKDVQHWKREVDKEHGQMIEHQVWQAILIRNIPKSGQDHDVHMGHKEEG